MYRIIEKSRQGSTSQFLIRLEDNAGIPFDNAKTDYQEYLEWLAEGNEPEVVNGDSPYA